MPQRTLYEVLMLHPTATHDVITAVYRQLAKQYHPDRSGPSGHEKMAQINEAYAVLSDPQKRARYDEIIGVSGSIELRQYARQSAPGATNLKYDGGSWSVRSFTEPTHTDDPYGEAGPPPAFPKAYGSILSFGRYKGWAISQVAAHDRNYVEWLSRTMAGRTYRAELERVLRQTPAA